MQQQIRDWLSERGMAQYADVLTAQNVDLAVLPDLTDQDLKDLGVLLGDRRKILAWAAELRRDCASSEENDGLTALTPPKDAERRQVTVLFCDLVDSTGLSRTLDPEDMREIIRAYQEMVSKTVRGFGGFIAGYRGDGVLVYFGYPEAHEDDAERAARAALALISAVSKIEHSGSLKTRVGIATGLVVVGDLIRDGDTQERNVVGETPNLAARLLTLAEPDSVVIADSTRQLLGDFFDLADLEFTQIKGFPQPIRSWIVLGSRSVESRYDAMHQELTALTGRDEELEILLRRWQRAKSGDGQVVLLSGEAGIGKSRLAAALMEQVSREPHIRLRYYCSPLHSETAFYPIISHLERAAGFEPGDNGTAKLTKLDALLDKNSRSLEDRALLAKLLSLEDDGRYPPLSRDPQQRRYETIMALVGLLFQHAAQKPVLMILEDVHWIDPTSLEAFSSAIEGIRKLPFLFIITFRPEFSAPWAGQSHVSLLSLKRLEQREISAFIEHLCETNSLSADIQAQIAERSDGIPLFIEEMTKAALESERLIVAGETAALKIVPAVEIPSSLQASLLARLDRLGPAHAVAQAGAVIGRSFSYPVLATVVAEVPGELDRALERLVRSGLLFQQGQAHNATYYFKHALIRDAAYGTLLREPRRALHARVLEALERLFPDHTESQPALLAHHATEAGLLEKAVRYWGKAGQRSLERSALNEAIAQLSRALSHIAQLPSTRDLRRQEIEYQVALAQAVMHVKGYTAQETRESYERAAELIRCAIALGESLSDPLDEFSSLYGSWTAHFVGFDRDKALAIAATVLELAEHQKSQVAISLGQRMMGCANLFSGRLKQAHCHLDLAIVHSMDVDHLMAAVRFGHSPLCAALCYRSLALSLQGFPAAAGADVTAAVQSARQLGHAASLLQALSFCFRYSIDRGDYKAAAKVLDELQELSAAKGTAFWRQLAELDKGQLFGSTGQYRQAIEVLTSELSRGQAGGNIFAPHFTCHLAMAHARLGEFSQARDRISEALAKADAGNEHWSTSEIHCMAGEIEVLCCGESSCEAITHFSRALEIAQSQSAKMLELRAATSLARLWRDRGKTREAHSLLSPVYNWFTEGFDTIDLKQAKALLDELTNKLQSCA